MGSLWIIWAFISSFQGYSFSDPGPFNTLEECVYSVAVNHELINKFLIMQYNLDSNIEVPLFCVREEDLEEFLKGRAYKLEQDQI